MADRILLGQQPGAKSYVHFDALGAEIDVQYDEFDTDFAKAQVQAANDNPHVTEYGRQERVIPLHVLDRAIREKWMHDKEAWRRWANSPEGMFCGVAHNGRINKL